MRRRTFSKVCSSLIAAALVQPARSIAAVDGGSTAEQASAPYQRSQLVKADGAPLLLDELPDEQAWVFHYPFVTTPCFLMRRPAAADRATEAAGLPEHARLMAFSAICSHKMTHPARPISHISYRADLVRYRDHHGVERERGGVISCCSERSVYDVLDGGKVLAGPATKPLPRIILAVDAKGRITATGSEGPDLYDAFLDKFGFRLAMEHGVTDIRARAGGQTEAQPADTFSHQQVRCLVLQRHDTVVGALVVQPLGAAGPTD